jgi:hypothetical protein
MVLAVTLTVVASGVSSSSVDILRRFFGGRPEEESGGS